MKLIIGSLIKGVRLWFAWAMFVIAVAGLQILFFKLQAPAGDSSLYDFLALIVTTGGSLSIWWSVIRRGMR